MGDFLARLIERAGWAVRTWSARTSGPRRRSSRPPHVGRGCSVVGSGGAAVPIQLAGPLEEWVLASPSWPGRPSWSSAAAPGPASRRPLGARRGADVIPTAATPSASTRLPASSGAEHVRVRRGRVRGARALLRGSADARRPRHGHRRRPLLRAAGRAGLRQGTPQHRRSPVDELHVAIGRVRPGGTLLFMGGTGGWRASSGGLVAAMTALWPALVAAWRSRSLRSGVNLIAAGFVDTPRMYQLVRQPAAPRRAPSRSGSSTAACARMSSPSADGARRREAGLSADLPARLASGPSRAARPFRLSFPVGDLRPPRRARRGDAARLPGRGRVRGAGDRRAARRRPGLLHRHVLFRAGGTRCTSSARSGGIDNSVHITCR